MSAAVVTREHHPKGLYVLFFTEMWERFGFYSMLAMFVLYLRDDKQGFAWTAESATHLYANYLMFVYASPLIGGWIADKKLGYRNSVLLGGLIFMIGYFLLSVHSIAAVYAALTCLVVGNGFFKPNVSAMVGHLYPEGSALKDRAYNIFYMGINIGALLAPINAEIWAHRIGFNNAFAIAGFGMIVSVGILWLFRKHVEKPAAAGAKSAAASSAFGKPASSDIKGPPGIVTQAQTAAVTEDLPPGPSRSNPIDLVPDFTRILALVVIFLIVIVFWMVFHQNGSTLVYWADDNTAWQVSGIISGAINAFWVVALTFPLVAFWGWLNRLGMEPSTPTKIMFGMLLCGASFGLLYLAARLGETETVSSEMLAVGDFRITDRSLEQLKNEKVPDEVIEELKAKDRAGTFIVKGKKFSTDRTYQDGLATIKQEFGEEVKQAQAALAWHRYEDKALQVRIAGTKDEPAQEKWKKELERHRAGKTALEERLKRAKKDAEALKDVEIPVTAGLFAPLWPWGDREGQLLPPAERGPEANAAFARALEKVIAEAKDLSPEGAAKVRRLAEGTFTGKEKLERALARPTMLGPDDAAKYGPTIEKKAYLFKMSPWWLILAYAVVTLGELMLSPMGLSLVSKVAPVRLRGVMMGGWFVATAIGNKLTMIGVYWEQWRQSTFFAVLGAMAVFMGLVLLVLLPRLKKAMPGV